MNEPRTYRHSPVLYIVLLLAALLVVGLALPLALGDETYLLPWLALPLAIIVGIAILRMTSEVVVSDTDITSRQLWSSRSLAWREIHRVTGTSNGLKLHNYDGDVTVTLNSHLPRFEEVMETIAEKRPDLFADPELQSPARNAFFLLVQILFALAIVGVDIWVLTQTDSQAWFSALLFTAIGVYLLINTLTAPRAVSVDGANLLVKYIAGEEVIRADEVRAVRLNFHRTRNGRMYFVDLERKDGKNVRLSHLRGGAMLTYLVLREWHRKHSLNK